MTICVCIYIYYIYSFIYLFICFVYSFIFIINFFNAKYIEAYRKPIISKRNLCPMPSNNTNYIPSLLIATETSEMEEVPFSPQLPEPLSFLLIKQWISCFFKKQSIELGCHKWWAIVSYSLDSRLQQIDAPQKYQFSEQRSPLLFGGVTYSSPWYTNRIYQSHFSHGVPSFHHCTRVVVYPKQWSR